MLVKLTATTAVETDEVATLEVEKVEDGDNVLHVGLRNGGALAIPGVSLNRFFKLAEEADGADEL